MKRFLRILLGLLLLLLGLGSAALGGLGIAVFGQQGSATGPPERIASTPASAAIVADLTGIDVALPFPDLLGEATLTVSGVGGESVFVGTGEQSDVDTYLFGVPYDLATRNGAWTLTAVPGVETEAPDPKGQTFWNERSVGTRATLALEPGADPQTLVITNADGSGGVDVEVALGFRGENIFWYSVAAVATGVVLIALGLITMLRRGRREQIVQITSDDDASLGDMLQESTGAPATVRDPSP